MKELCKSLLKEWCETLLKLQIVHTGDPRLDGGILCPACGRIHGRCFEAMYPFLYLAKAERNEKWICAAERLFIWAEYTLSQADGSFFNDLDSSWKGTTVFNVIQLADCFLLHEDILKEEIKTLWKNRLRHAAEFLYNFEELKENNINYPISNALALYESGVVLQESTYIQKAKELASIAEAVITESGLLIGEGLPHFQRSKRGCFPIDIGYNVEETLPSLAIYASLNNNKNLLELAEKSLSMHLNFMLEDGGWDNSFGTRNFKWTYWGSRTSDGCALGYLLFGKTHPEFVLAAQRNLQLLKACTNHGLLAGGPHYQSAGQPSCVHHTFTHGKVLAGILDRKLYVEEKENSMLPRKMNVGQHYYQEIGSWLVNLHSMTATVTAYDWEYLSGGHVSGGTLSLLHHYDVGTILCAGVSQYTLKEPNNMQISQRVKHECLALRIEMKKNDVLYSSLYENSPQIIRKPHIIMVKGYLKDIEHKQAPGEVLTYCFSYKFQENKLTINAEYAKGMLICPLVSKEGEPIIIGKQRKSLFIQKEKGRVIVQTNRRIKLPYGEERIFNLVPGFQALQINIDSNYVELEILVEAVTSRNCDIC